MTTFKQISGQLVRSYTSDPDNPQEGQMWYNQTSLSLRGVVASSAWSSGAPTTEDKTLLSGGAILFILLSTTVIALVILLIRKDHKYRLSNHQFHPPHGTVSSDGLYEWDGSTWLPIAQDTPGDGEFWVWNGSEWVPNPELYQK